METAGSVETLQPMSTWGARFPPQLVSGLKSSSDSLDIGKCVVTAKDETQLIAFLSDLRRSKSPNLFLLSSKLCFLAVLSNNILSILLWYFWHQIITCLLEININWKELICILHRWYFFSEGRKTDKNTYTYIRYTVKKTSSGDSEDGFQLFYKLKLHFWIIKEYFWGANAELYLWGIW